MKHDVGVLSEPQRLPSDRQLDRQILDPDQRLAVAQALAMDVPDRTDSQQTGHFAPGWGEFAGEELVEAGHLGAIVGYRARRGSARAPRR